MTKLMLLIRRFQHKVHYKHFFTFVLVQKPFTDREQNYWNVSVEADSLDFRVLSVVPSRYSGTAYESWFNNIWTLKGYF